MIIKKLSTLTEIVFAQTIHNRLLMSVRTYVQMNL